MELSAHYNIAKSTTREWLKKYGQECQDKHSTQKNSESNFSSKIHQLNQMLREKDKEIDLLKKSSSILCKENRFVVYRFINHNKEYFGISPSSFFQTERQPDFRQCQYISSLRLEQLNLYLHAGQTAFAFSEHILSIRPVGIYPAGQTAFL